MFDGKVLIKGLPSFSLPKIMVIWHVKPILKLQQTWQTRTVLWKTARTLNKASQNKCWCFRNLHFEQLPCVFEQLPSVNNHINNKHPCKHVFSSCCLFPNDFFLFLSGINKYKTGYINMVTVEASIMSPVCWNLKVFLQCGLSPWKRRTNLLMVCLGLQSTMIRQGY